MELSSKERYMTFMIIGMCAFIGVMSLLAVVYYSQATSTNATMNTQTAQLQTTIDQLQEERDTLQAQVTSLQNDKATLQNQVGTLQGQTATLQEQITTLQDDNAELVNQVNALNQHAEAFGDYLAWLNTVPGRTLNAE